MKTNYFINEEKGFGYIENIFDKQIKNDIVRTFCPFVIPWKKSDSYEDVNFYYKNGEKIDSLFDTNDIFTKCSFFDKNNVEVSYLLLKNSDVLSAFNRKQNFIFVNNYEHIIFPLGWNKNETKCYDWQGKIIWTSPIEKAYNCELFCNFLYCCVGSNILTIAIVDTLNGNVQYPFPQFSDSYSLVRFDEHLIIYYFGFLFVIDMQKKEFKISNFKIVEPCKFLQLKTIKKLNDYVNIVIANDKDFYELTIMKNELLNNVSDINCKKIPALSDKTGEIIKSNLEKIEKIIRSNNNSLNYLEMQKINT